MPSSRSKTKLTLNVPTSPLRSVTGSFYGYNHSDKFLSTGNPLTSFLSVFLDLFKSLIRSAQLPID